MAARYQYQQRAAFSESMRIGWSSFGTVSLLCHAADDTVCVLHYRQDAESWRGFLYLCGVLRMKSARPNLGRVRLGPGVLTRTLRCSDDSAHEKRANGSRLCILQLL